MRSIQAFEQPLILARVIGAVFPVQFRGLQTKIKTVLFLFGNFIAAEGELPHHAAAVFAFRNCAFKMEVLEGMIFNIDRQALDAGPGRQPFRYGPGF